MNIASKILTKYLLVAAFLVTVHCAGAAQSKSDARVTRIIRDVKLLPPEAAAKPAAINDKVHEDTGVRTGQESRSELTFVDLTITRLGANTIFTFNKAGRNAQLNNGSMLLYVPKDSGGAHMTTSAVSVAITGTTLILESLKAGRTKLTIMEGGARASLRKYPRESVYVRAGQMIDVPAGATKMPQPVNINMKDAMKSPLITDFAPLPSQPLIVAGQNPPTYGSQPVVGQPVGTFPTFPIPPFGPGRPGQPGQPGRPGKPTRPGGSEPGGATPTTGDGSGDGTTVQTGGTRKPGRGKPAGGGKPTSSGGTQTEGTSGTATNVDKTLPPRVGQVAKPAGSHQSPTPPPKKKRRNPVGR